MSRRNGTMRDETFDEQARRTTLPVFNAEVARRLGEITVNIAARRSLAVAVGLALPERPLYFCALDGSNAENVDWIRRKQNTVFHFERSSLEVGVMLERDGQRLVSLDLPEEHYATYGGGVPLRVADEGIVGAMCVSGLEHVADHELVVEALCWHLGIPHFNVILTQVAATSGRHASHSSERRATRA
ncbi:heme-binding protein [Paraburkholderia tagetis]|uniref:Heme-binding protein n=1 Tax=Paraburkholderia tagetis TaxID=2913261 RepID=A0A9X1ZYE7_9BURK|nr:heme-binding protein [Paraburkholderia tagetis]MCG5078317.1 heme-binding protein [Paraburkholderia tagetis]